MYGGMIFCSFYCKTLKIKKIKKKERTTEILHILSDNTIRSRIKTQ